MSNTEQTCFHCGEDCITEKIEYNAKFFCCNGCLQVFQILNSAGLNDFYSIEKTPGVSQKNKASESKFDYLSNEEIVSKLLEFEEGNTAKITLSLPQIHCSSCIWLLERLHNFENGIVSSRINFLKKEAYISFKKDIISLKKIVNLLCSIGYEPNITLNDSKKTINKKNNQKFYIKLGVAGFCFGNIMLLSFPEYISIDDISDDFQKIFGYLNFGLSIPILLFSASDYFKSAWAGIKNKFFNIDVPISLGISALFIRSSFDIFMNTGAGFMDSLAGFVFFLLIGKWFQNKTYDALSFERDYTSYFPLSATLLQNEKRENVLVENLKPQDTIEIRNEELIPCDSILNSETAKIDYSFVTGESKLVSKKKGDLLYAGGKQIGSSILATVQKEVSQSYLTRLWNQDIFSKQKVNTNKSIVNKVSQYFTAIIIVIALCSAIAWYFIDSSKIFDVFTAILIVACPCALALTLPFAYGNSMRILGRIGVYLRNAETTEELKDINTIVFDKTGTISTNKNKTSFIGNALSENEKSIIKSVVKHSSHPLSVAVFQHLNASIFPTSSFQEIPSKGIIAKIGHDEIKIGSNKFVGAKNIETQKLSSEVHVSINEIYLGYFSIEKEYRNGLNETIAQLNKKHTIYLISGDNDSEKNKLSNVFKTENMFFDQSPEDKLNFVKNLQNEGKKVMMIGDGLNDAGALKQSNVGVAISDDINTFSPSCDIILASENFSIINQVLEFSKSIQKVIISSFVFSFSYNITGLLIAISGLLTPLFAAILMPLSSISVVIFVSLFVTVLSKKYTSLKT